MAGSVFQRFYNLEGEYVPLEQLIDWLREHPLPGQNRIVPLMIWGGMGIGKTQQIKAYAKSRNLMLRTYHPAHDVNGGDIVGQAYTDDQGRTSYALPAWLPTDEDPPGLLFIDEINRAPDLVLAGLMEPLGEGTIAQSGWQLPKDWNIVAAANPSELGYTVTQMDEAMIDRLLHYAPGWDAPAWAAWAQSAELDPSIINFALRNPEAISSGEAQLPHELTEKLRATPRSLEYIASLYEPNMPPGLLRVVSEGLLGRDAAETFRNQHAGEQPLSFEEVLEGKYDPRLQDWQGDLNLGDPLIRASSELVVAALIVRKSPDDWKEDPERIAWKVGRWFAQLPPHLRDEAINSIDRSANAWTNPVREATLLWQRQLGQEVVS